MSSAYSYCPKCQAAMPAATMFDVIANRQHCPNGHGNPPNRDKAAVLIEMYEELKVLRDEVDQLREQVASMPGANCTVL